MHKATMTPSLAVLSEDLIAEVLSFLPVKSVVRFRCVNKSWETLISDPIFVKLHLQKSQSRNPNLFTLITLHINLIPENEEYEEEFSLVRSPINRMFENPSFTRIHNPNHHINNKGSRNGSFMVGSCNGLILFSDRSKHDEYRFRVWNPATRTSSEKIGYFHDRDTFCFAFGCDNSTETYKVVAYCNRETTSDVRVLNLGGDHVWRYIESFPAVLGHNRVYLSGTMNWLATVEHTVIVSLDLETETYNQYTLPRGADEVQPNAPTIGVLRGCLCFSYADNKTDFVILQMKKFGVEDSWTQLLKISYHDLLIDYGNFSDDDRSDFQLVPLFLSEDGDSLILRSSLESQTILYNRRDNRAKRTEIIASTTTADNGTGWYVYWDFTKDYVESLVPIF